MKSLAQHINESMLIGESNNNSWFDLGHASSMRKLKICIEYLTTENKDQKERMFPGVEDDVLHKMAKELYKQNKVSTMKVDFWKSGNSPASTQGREFIEKKLGCKSDIFKTFKFKQRENIIGIFSKGDKKLFVVGDFTFTNSPEYFELEESVSGNSWKNK